ncbi:hypothetical protein SAY86_009076 [Trapa natans]|uniref:HMA domain-containing protein n=1 Tax=Trapa natans TaxID=22666 RepID=A0AAN7QC68_TRANT|nr:hypothetical protein SAY86_009076 [Trapa natans]
MAEKKDNGKKNHKGVGGEAGTKVEKKNDSNVIILKIDIHCQGCASKIIKYAKAFEGVEKAKLEWGANKLTVEGKVDPTKIREMLQEKIKKKVEIVSPQLHKDKENKDDSTTNNKCQGKKADHNKPEELAETTGVLKLRLHCNGCVQKLHKIVSKTSGVKSVAIERQKDLVTVKGTMEVKVLAESLKGRMKRAVEIVTPPKKDEKVKDRTDKKESSDNSSGNGGCVGGGNDKKSSRSSSTGNINGSGNNGGKNKKNKGGGTEGSNAGCNKDEENAGGTGRMDGSRMEYYGPVGYLANTGYEYEYGYGHGYGYAYWENVHAPQYFCDENPSACSVM